MRQDPGALAQRRGGGGPDRVRDLTGQQPGARCLGHRRDGGFGPLRVMLGGAAVQPDHQLDRAEPVGDAVVALDGEPGPPPAQALNEE